MTSALQRKDELSFTVHYHLLIICAIGSTFMTMYTYVALYTAQFTILVARSFPDLRAMSNGRVCSRDDESVASAEVSADTRDYRFCGWKNLDNWSSSASRYFLSYDTFWGFLSTEPGVARSVSVDAKKTKGLGLFETSGTDKSATQRHFPEKTDSSRTAL